MPVLHQSMCISKACLSSLRYDRTEYKGKVPDVSDSSQNFEISKEDFSSHNDLLPPVPNTITVGTEKWSQGVSYKQGRYIRRTSIFIFSFCIGLVTQLNGSALRVLKHHYIIKRIRELLIGNLRFLIYDSLNQLLCYTI